MQTEGKKSLGKKPLVQVREASCTPKADARCLQFVHLLFIMPTYSTIASARVLDPCLCLSLSIKQNKNKKCFLPIPTFNRRNNNAEFFHNIERFPRHIARRIQFDGHECVGRRLYGLHLCIATGIRLRQLRGPQTAIA